MKTDDYFDQTDDLKETPPWSEKEIEIAEIAEDLLSKDLI
jgi:hypothetical protein